MMRNGEGYDDPTAAGAVELMRERKGAQVVLQSMVRFAGERGFEVVVLRLRSTRSGRVHEWV